MNFEWTAEQAQLRDSLQRILARTYSFETRRAIEASKEGWSRTAWEQLAAIGVTALAIPESHGGFGGGAVELMPVLEEFGRVLLMEPFIASSVLGSTALRAGGDDAARSQWLPVLASGAALLAFAHDEPGGRHAPLWIQTRATRSGASWLLDGRKINVLHGSLADCIIVSARVSGTADAQMGIGLFLLEQAAPGVTLRQHRLVDGTLAAEICLASATARALGEPGGTSAAGAIAAAVGAGIAAACAESVGAMRAAYELTALYLNTRQQFGRTIGSNQALRHRFAEMLVSLETARSAATMAALAVDDPGADNSPADLARAKMLIGRHGRFVLQQCIQLHGAIGMTDEYAVGHYLRRFTVLDQLFGDADAHASRLAELFCDGRLR